MICHGSRTCRFQGSRESAWDIINRLDLEGSRQRRAPLQIQLEMVDHGLLLHETTAAKTLLRSLIQLAGEVKKVWEKLRNKARRITNPREPSGGLRRDTFLRRSSTNRSSSSETGRSMVSSRISRITSRNSTPPSSPAESTSSGCSVNGRRDTLLATIRILRLAHQMADIAPVPMLRGVIGTVLHIAQLVEVSTPLLTARRGPYRYLKEMGGTHHAINQVIDNSAWLLEEITQFAVGSKLSKDMERTLNSFQRHVTSSSLYQGETRILTITLGSSATFKMS